jgi:hypothetical protein
VGIACCGLADDLAGIERQVREHVRRHIRIAGDGPADPLVLVAGELRGRGGVDPWVARYGGANRLVGIGCKKDKRRGRDAVLSGDACSREG